jgi:alpha-beta hydrolase superfamily lysophospholipase
MKNMFVAVIGLFLVAACEPTIRAGGPIVRAPELALSAEHETRLIASDGKTLPMRHWMSRNNDGPADAILIALHGFNEYSNVFADPAAWWADQRIEVYAYDQRGFGKSEPRGLWPGNPTLVRDLKDVVRAIGDRHPGVPLFLLGTSMGGAVIMSALDERYPEGRDLARRVSGIILSAPAVWGRSEMHPFFQLALWLSAHTIPAGNVTGRGLGVQASDNVEMLKALGRDPLIIKQTRIDAVFGVVGMMDAGLAGAAGLRAETLLLYGENDQIVPPHAIDNVLQRLEAPYRYVRYPGGWHMLLHDLQAKTVWQDIAAWIKNRSGALPSGHEIEKIKPTSTVD